MKTKNIFKTTLIVSMVAMGMASCDDWLTIHPQTQIVEENFWEDKNDLEGVRYAVYKNMANQIEKMIIWGDLRSDQYKLNTLESGNQGNRDNFRNILQANIDTTWSYYDWSGIYSTIGYCNKVLQHGEEVLEKDKQFAPSEWKQMKAEMVTMRALCYFYLVRSFKNIPFTTKVVNSDSEVEYFPQLSALEVLDTLIKDVESVAGQGRNRFVSMNETKGMITNTAIYTLLGDMYLWRASMREGRSKNNAEITKQMFVEDYQKCIYYSELAASKLQEQFEEESKNSYTNLNNFINWSNAPTFNGKSITFMYKNDVDEANNKIVDLKAYEEIFGKGNSYESIFELQYSKEDSRKNGTVHSMWGNFNGTHLVSSIKNDVFDDTRYWFSSWNNIFTKDVASKSSDRYSLKWMGVDFMIEDEEDVRIVPQAETNEYTNWIIYRLSDILLNNAEARACLAMLEVDKNNNEDISKRLLRMVNRRWWIDLANGGEPSTDVSKQETYDELKETPTDSETKRELLTKIMQTRKIEFASEGKRWFDLVRFAERLSNDDNDNAGMLKMFEVYFKDYYDDYETTQSRCENLWGLYSPIYYMECKAYRAKNATITQNPIWNKSRWER